MVSRCDNSLPITVRSSMLWFGIPTIIFIAAPHALHTLTSIPAPEGIKAAPLNTRLSLFAGLTFRTAQALTPACSWIRLFPSIGLYISAGRLYLANTLRCHALSVPTVRRQHSMKSHLGGPSFLRSRVFTATCACSENPPTLPNWPVPQSSSSQAGIVCTGPHRR